MKAAPATPEPMRARGEWLLNATISRDLEIIERESPPFEA